MLTALVRTAWRRHRLAKLLTRPPTPALRLSVRQAAAFVRTTTTVAFGYDGRRMTIDEFLRSSLWLGIHPEIRRRLWALIVFTDYQVGVGGARRLSARQIALFIGRHERTTLRTSIWWAGSFWRLKPGNAPAAIPGESYHEPVLNEAGDPDDSDATGLCVAIDTLELAAAGITPKILKAFGLLNFKGEFWHVQPSEWPTARRTWNKKPRRLDRWPLPDEPTPPAPPAPAPPTMEDDEMPRLIQPAEDPAIFLADGLTVTWVPDGNVLVALQPLVASMTITKVNRIALKALVLRGPVPVYGTHPSTQPGRTRSGDFAAHQP